MSTCMYWVPTWYASAWTPEPKPWSTCTHASASTPEPKPSSRPTSPPTRLPLQPTPVPTLRPTDSAAKLKELLAGGQAAMEDLIIRCSVGIPIEVLQHKGLGMELRRRLSIALGVDLWSHETGRLVSRLGKAKYHLYTPGQIQ